MTDFSHSVPSAYQIQVRGHLGEHWASRFEGFNMSLGLTRDEIPITTLSGPIADQAALHGMLARIRDMGMELLAVNRVETGDDNDGAIPDELS